ncbi:hypothetical protein, partial [Enterobacter cloacae complex sp. CH23B]|uniref:hypothetical protein n=1 Tax=Enterobacter cloacae complex sp. CH23B TaxID=2511986 RepID=UPI001CA49D06
MVDATCYAASMNADVRGGVLRRRRYAGFRRVAGPLPGYTERAQYASTQLGARRGAAAFPA